MMNLTVGLASLTAFGVLLGMAALWIARSDCLAIARVIADEERMRQKPERPAFW